MESSSQRPNEMLLQACEISVRTIVEAVDVSCLLGADASALMKRLIPTVRRLNYFYDALGARTVETNQHNVSGAKSSSDHLARQQEISEREARRKLAFQKKLSENPDVEARVRDGSLSEEKAEIIATAADGEAGKARELLAIADKCSLEELRRKASMLNRPAPEDAAAKLRRLRRSQFVSIRRDANNMVFGQFRFSVETAAPWFSVWLKTEREARRLNERLKDPLPPSAAGAEAFSRMIADGIGAQPGEIVVPQAGGSQSGGSQPGPSPIPAPKKPKRTAGHKAAVTYHVRLEDWSQHWPKSGPYCEVPGLGPVPASVLDEIPDDSPLRLVVTSKNKMVWYSEGDYNAKRLPDFIKRAVKAANFDTCGINCTEVADEVDHIKARTNGGTNDIENLQSPCKGHHDSKTRTDAPWTAGGIYGVKREERERRRQAQREKEKRRAGPKTSDEEGGDAAVGDPGNGEPSEMFPETG